MMEITDMHISRWNKRKSLTNNLNHIFSRVTMDDPAVFMGFVRNTLRVTTQRTIDLIKNFVESFGCLMVVYDGNIDTFSRIPILWVVPERLHREYWSETTLPKDSKTIS